MKRITTLMAIFVLLSAAMLFSACNTQPECEHTLGEWTVRSAPACNMDGLRVKVCTKCGEDVESEAVEPVAHVEGEWQIISEPTCVKAGEKITVCIACEETVQVLEMPKAAHTESDWHITVQPSCSREGERMTACTVCGSIVSLEPLPKTEHLESDWIVDKPAIVGACGEKHTECTVCNAVIARSEIPALEEGVDHAHSKGDWVTAKAPTCTEDGVKTRYCTVCGETLETENIGKKGHTDGERTVEKTPTCTEDGRAVCKCTSCGDLTKEEVIPKTGHSESDWITDAISEVGIEGERHTECTSCGVEIRRENTPALETSHEHTFVEWKVTDEPSCLKAGRKIRYCTDPDCGETESAAIEKLPHSSYVILQGYPATNAVSGMTDGRKCGACGTVTIEQRVIELRSVSVKDIDILTHLRYEGYESGRLIFTWLTNGEYKDSLERIMVTVSREGASEEYKIVRGESSFEYWLSGDADKYKFTFTPITDDGIQGNSVQSMCHWLPEVREYDFPRVEITTRGGELPTCDFVSPPPGNWGGGTVNNEYVDSIITLYSGTDKLLYTSRESGFDGAKIRIRGNTSARGDKQPFRINLSQKHDLLSGLAERQDGIDHKDRDWVLMKCGYNLNFAVGSAVSEAVDMEWTPAYSYVALFINGDYRGLYVLTENVKDSDTRVDIKKTGYLVEMDAYWWNEDLYFTTPISEKHPAKLTFKYPDSNDITAESLTVRYIQNYLTDIENGLIAGADVSRKLDLESFAKWLLGHDILASYDSGGSNMYMYKEDNTNATKLMMGPLWDFDSIYWSQEKWRPDKFARIREGKFFYMYYLLKNESFRAVYKELYTAARGNIVSAVSDTIDKYDNESYAKLLEYEKWRWKSGYPSVESEKVKILNWFEEHLAWMDENVK